MKKVISAIIAVALISGSIPVLAVETNLENEISEEAFTEAEEIIGSELATPIPIAEVEAEETDKTVYEVDEEPIVFEENVDNLFEFPEEDEVYGRDPLPGPGEINFFAEIEEQNSWESVYAAMFGDAYLAPYKKHEDGQTINGNTNRLVIEETDLSLPGKNGLDLVLKRKYDNQDCNDAYVVKDFGNDSSEQSIYVWYIYCFTNMSTYESIYIGFLSTDEMYIYAYNGFNMTSISGVKPVADTINGERIEYYRFEDIYNHITEDTSSDRYEYDSSKPPIKYQKKNGYIQYSLKSRMMLQNNGNLGNRWYLMLPEAYMVKDNSFTETYNNYKKYTEEYVGAFRDIEGDIYSFTNDVVYRKYDNNSGQISSYSSKISNNGSCMDMECYYNTRQLGENGPEYNFVVYDGNGLTYYMYNPGYENTQTPLMRQPVYIIAVEDLYGNRISYEYSDNYENLTKIIDTYGREINISYTTNKTTISYYDETAGATKTIIYATEVLPSSTLDNDSPLKGKEVHRFTVTNQEGEKTIYDSRETENINYYYYHYYGSDYKLFSIPEPNNASLDISEGYNVERIIYPTGDETRYRYKSMYTYSFNTKIRRGVYAVEAAYDLVDGRKENYREYSFENDADAITVICDNNAENSRTVMEYNGKGLIEYSKKSPINKDAYEEITYDYDNGDMPIEVVTKIDGNVQTMTYEYIGSYRGKPSSESNGQYKIDYEYYTRPYTTNGSNYTRTIKTNLISSITYTDVSGNIPVEDYKITTTRTPDNKNIEYERVEQDGVIKSQLKYEYDSEGNITSVKQWINDTNADGKLDENDEVIEIDKTYALSDQKLLTVSAGVNDIINADGENEGDVTDEYSYNISGMPLSHKDSYGTVTTIAYDGINRPVKYTMANGGIRRIEYNTSQKFTTVTDEAGVITKYETDGLGRNKAKYVKDGSSYRLLELYSYDTAGRLSSKKIYRDSDEGTMETYSYDILGRVIETRICSLTGSTINTTEYEYDYKKITKTTSGNTADQISYYDFYGNLIKTESVSGNDILTTLYENDYMGRPVKVTDPNGNETLYEYRYDGKVTKQTNAEGNCVSTVYDLAGQTVSVTDANGNTTNAVYDKLGRAVKVNSPFSGNASAESKTYYDKNSNIVKTAVKRSGNLYEIQEYKYDIMGNMIAQIANDGTTDIVNQYQYDTANRITKMFTGLSEYSENPNGGAVTQYSYNNLGYLSQITDPMGMKESYSYDYAGNVIAVTDKNAKTMHSVYGTFGLEKSYFDGTDETKEYEYNNIGQIIGTKAVNADQSIVEESYSYDAFGRLISKTSSNGAIQTYSYDPASNLTYYTLERNGFVNNRIEYTYNTLNQLTELKNNGIITSYEYDANGNLIEKALDNGIVTDYTYNNAGMLTRVTTKKNNTEYINSDCSYYLNGLMQTATESFGGNNDDIYKYFEYDDIGRLTDEYSLNSEGIPYYYQYTYDLRGNRIKKTTDKCYREDASESNYIYDLNNRLLSEETSVEKEDPAGTETTSVRYYYDNNGNMTAKQSSVSSSGEMTLSGRSSDNGMEIYRYDAFNRLVNYNSGSAEASYRYNSDNLRTQKTVNRAITDYVWNGQNLASEYYGGEYVNSYTYDMNGVHITNHAGLLSVYIKDYHGNIIGKANSSGELRNEPEERTDYDSFGNVWTGNSPDPFGYCGEYLDSESGLIYLRNRYYDSSTGRFITEDPAQDGLNWYVYAANNPVILVDPWGLAAGDLFASIEEALADMYYCYYGFTDYTKIEQAFLLYMGEDKTSGEAITYYSYTEPVEGDCHMVNYKGIEIPEGTTEVGRVHTHANINDEMLPLSDTFSSLDGFSAIEHDVYLLNASGEVRYLEEREGGISGAPSNNERIPGEVIMTGLTYEEMKSSEKYELAREYGEQIIKHFNSCTDDEVLQYHNKNTLKYLELYKYYGNYKYLEGWKVQSSTMIIC